MKKMDLASLKTNEDMCHLQSCPQTNEHTLTIVEGYSDRLKDDLSQALKNGKWETIEGMIRENLIEVFKTRLNENGDTLLLSAFSEGKKELITRLVEKVTPDLLAETDNFGNTALHLAANVGLVEDAKKIVKKRPDLLNCRNEDKILPIQLAMKREQENARIMTSYLLKEGMNDENHSKLLKEAAGAGAGVMQSLIKARFYDLALELLEFNDKLAWEEESTSPLNQMASDPGGFKSGYPFTGWQSIIYSYSCVPTNQNGRTENSQGRFAVYKNINNLLARVLVHGNIPGLKLKHHHALQLVNTLCSHIKKMEGAQEKLGKPLLLGAQNGIEEIVREILDSLPTTITYLNEKKQSIFHVAVMYRHESILRMAHEKNKNRKGTYYQNPDDNDDNILHFVGYKPRQARIDTDSEAIFKMQRELQWFKKVSELVTPQESNRENKDNKIPFALFKEQHADMAAKDKKWMSDMATASSVAASLVATVAFSAAFQVPGGNDDCGIPNFSDKSSFMVFAISDALALFSAITSVLTFLSIFTSRYGDRDYQSALPHRVIIGLISLLFAFIFLMMAFSSAFFIVLVHKSNLIRIPIITLSFIPVILYAKLQLPSLYAMIKSTYYPSFDRWEQCVLFSNAIKLRI